MKKFYEKEEDLKKDLDALGFRFGDRFNHISFVASYIDSRTGSEIAQFSVSSPINALRILPQILEQKKLNADDVSVSLEFVYDMQTRKFADVQTIISPYMYFKKTEEKKENNK